MSIFGAMVTAVTGLRGQSYALENISDNIANSQTVGYKRVDTTFEDLIPDYPLTQQIGGSVSASSRGTNTVAGNYSATGVGTNVAINGTGFFIVRDTAGYTGGQPTSTAKDLYTRRGDFELDKNGFLMNGAGRYLVGNPADATTGAIQGGAPTVLQFNSDQVPAQQTSTVEYRANLPSIPQTVLKTSGGTHLFNPALFADTTGANIRASEETTFTDRTISGGTVTMYDGLGTQVNAQLRWAKTADAATTPAVVSDTWKLYYMTDPAATGTATKWTATAQTYQFSSNGAMTAPVGTIIQPTMTIGTTSFSNIELDTGLTQFAQLDGQVATSVLRQDGFGAGKMDDLSVSADGRMVASYSNGQTKTLAQLAVAQFKAANMLKRRDGGTFQETLESGQPVYGLNGANIMSGQLEGSNTDIAEEFSKMIITQQAYSANTRVVTTAQQMLQDAINIIR
jgi:flagellar hook protein FlgE